MSKTQPSNMNISTTNTTQSAPKPPDTKGEPKPPEPIILREGQQPPKRKSKQD